jgi:hypothetical protein
MSNFLVACIAGQGWVTSDGSLSAWYKDAQVFNDAPEAVKALLNVEPERLAHGIRIFNPSRLPEGASHGIDG